jgi:hypothetical protein
MELAQRTCSSLQTAENVICKFDAPMFQKYHGWLKRAKILTVDEAIKRSVEGEGRVNSTSEQAYLPPSLVFFAAM